MRLRQGDKENNFNGEKLKISFTMTKKYVKVRNAIFHQTFSNQMPVGCDQKKCYRRFSRGAKGEFTREALTYLGSSLYFFCKLFVPIVTTWKLRPIFDLLCIFLPILSVITTWMKLEALTYLCPS